MSERYKKWEIVSVDLNPTKGAEIAKMHPCVIVSPNAVNAALSTVIIIPFTSTNKITLRGYPLIIKENQGHWLLTRLKR